MLTEAGFKLLVKCGLSPEHFDEITRQHQCPQHIVLGIIKTESGGNPLAMRYEPPYPYLDRPEKWAAKFAWTKTTEEALQRFSYGLMQIMLATARSHSFGLHPRDLLIPRTNVAWGCYHLKSLHSKYLNWPDAVAAYNYGHAAKTLLTKRYKNQAYVDLVFGSAGEFRLNDGPSVA